MDPWRSESNLGVLWACMKPPTTVAALRYVAVTPESPQCCSILMEYK